MSTTKEQRLIDELTDCPNLTPWEEQFLESIQDTLIRFGRLTDKQRQTLTKIHEQRILGW